MNNKPAILNVIENDYCIGCGVCTQYGNATMEISDFGTLSVDISSETLKDTNALEGMSRLCPFGSNPLNETSLMEGLSDKEGVKYDEKIGYYNELYAGHVAKGSYRDNGSSGGSVSWFIGELFAQDKIDFVVHVKAGTSENLFQYGISYSAEESSVESKSKYYPISLVEILKMLPDINGRGAIVGIPCFIKAMKFSMNEFPSIREKIKYTIGLVCGHLKSQFFSYNYSVQLGIMPENLTKIDFRHKEEGYQGLSNHYFVKATGVDESGNEVSKVGQNKSFFGFLWGHGFFKYKACDYCDDVYAETADVCFGDAWIEPYVNDSRGDNIVVVRNAELKEVFENSIENGSLNYDLITPEQIKKSQDAGLRHRRQGVASRIENKKKLGLWTPEKREFESTKASDVGEVDKKIFIYREEMSRISQVEFKKYLSHRSYEKFQNKMKTVLSKNDWLYAQKKGTVAKIKVILKRILKR